MAEDLKAYLETHPPQGFRPVPHYFPQGDFVTYYFRKERCYAQPVDDLLTVFLAFDSHELVGCKITGVKHILQTARAFGVTLDGGDIPLGLFLFVGASLAKNGSQKQRYEELRRVAQAARLDQRELPAAS